ncbi:MAG: alpha-galactosidase [Clostridiales bacterium]|nr:alpha-galactosidase [Clostridiales bacterium]
MTKQNSIRVDEQQGILRLDTANTTYVMGISNGLYLGHLYYGAKIPADDLSYRTALTTPMSPENIKKDFCVYMDSTDFEYPGWGIGDSREGAIKVRDALGSTRTNLIYKGYRISSSKALIPGLPATFASESDPEDVSTLEVDLQDPDTGLLVTLFYSAFWAEDIIARHVEVRNEGKNELVLERVLSASVDMRETDRQGKDLRLMTFYGIWAREFTKEIREIGHGRTGVSSIIGKTNNRAQPFLGLVSQDITQVSGEVYGLNFLYSGNFASMVEKNPNGGLRVSVGIHPEEFSWHLAPGEVFYAPEVVMTYSCCGLGKMSRNFHDLYRKHLIRGSYKDRKRPILINNWEATYFDFDTEKLLAIAKKAKECGIEMLVMDDGWFGKRNDPDSSLGDWWVNEEKLTGGLARLGRELEDMGMKFGIWFEPEMVSPDSELYRTHPDWAIAVPGREPSRSRNQLVLDVSREEVRDHIFNSMYKVLTSTKISYVKWDMNRHLTDLYSAGLPDCRQGELLHRFVLGVYDLQQRLLTAFPDLLLENCSSGGARFDPGMLYFSPQIWTSDDTDAYERIRIQEGAQMLYPLSCLGAHVSVCPNHVTGRVVPFKTRGHIALSGTFGYELDITKLSEEEHEMIRQQTAMYHKYNDLIRTGDFYRMASFRENGFFDCYGVVSKDKSEMLLTFIHVMNQPCMPTRWISIQGLDPDKLYAVEQVDDSTIGPSEQVTDATRKVCQAHGATLAHAGLIVPCRYGDFQSVLYRISEVKE